MKSLKVLALVIAGFSAQLKADKIFNSGATLGVNSGVSDTTVNANSVFTATAFDPVNKITYLGETSSTTASAQNLMKSKVASDGTISVTSISGTLTTLQNGVGKTVSKLIVTEDGDLAVLFTNHTNFYVVKNAWSDNPSDWTLVTSPVAKDGNATITSTKFINLAYAGKNSTGARFVAVIPETATTSLANEIGRAHV